MSSPSTALTKGITLCMLFFYIFDSSNSSSSTLLRD